MDKTQVFQLRSSSPKLVFLAYYHMEIHIATAVLSEFLFKELFPLLTYNILSKDFTCNTYILNVVQ